MRRGKKSSVKGWVDGKRGIMRSGKKIGERFIGTGDAKCKELTYPFIRRL